MTAASILALSALRAQDPAAVDTAPTSFAEPALPTASDADGTPATVPPTPEDVAPQITAPTTPDEAEALDQTIYGGDEAADEAAAEPVAQGRSWKVNLHASAGTRYDNNIFIASTGKQADIVTGVTAGAGLTLGDFTDKKGNYLIADYTGIGEFFERHTNQDAYEQNASLEGKVNLAHLTIQGNFSFQDLSEEDIDVGTRTQQDISFGSLAVRYDISDKSYVEATGQVTLDDYQTYLDSNDERGGLSFNYLPDPDLTVGLGVMAGVLHVEDSGSQPYEQLLASAKMNVTDKFTLIADAGIENRQLVNGGSLTTPVFQLTADYKPFEGLDLSLTGYRQVVNSASYSGYDYISTGVTANVRYELSSRFSVLMGGGYVNMNYKDSSGAAGISRDDDYFYVRPAFRYTASQYWNVELYYLYSEDDSTLATSSFNDTQVGLTFTFAF